MRSARLIEKGLRYAGFEAKNTPEVSYWAEVETGECSGALLLADRSESADSPRELLSRFTGQSMTRCSTDLQ